MKIKRIFRFILLGIILWFFSTQDGLEGVQIAQASLDHQPNFSHIKTALIDYMGNPSNEIKQFIASHYDAIDGPGRDYRSYTSSPPPQFSYTNYYCIYVGSPEYIDAQNWATARGVNFEDFFIHFAEPTTASFGSDSRTVPAGSRVPTYYWNTKYPLGDERRYDLTIPNARIITNPGNPNYRAWKIDYLQREFFGNNPNIDGTFIDNTSFKSIPSFPTISSGGAIIEYPSNPHPTYGNDMITMFQEAKTGFGPNKGQLPNVANSNDSGAADKVYSYVWGLWRENTLQPDKVQTFSWIYNNIYNSENAGVKNIIHGIANSERYVMPLLAEFYLFKTDSTYFGPILTYKHNGYDVDPRVNQWFEAMAYDIGQPKNDPALAQKYRVYYHGIDPASARKDTMNAASITRPADCPLCYQLNDSTKSWADEYWQFKRIIFPDGKFSMQIYHSGPAWVKLYNPSKVPTVGTYQLGSFTYNVYGREYEKALVLFKGYSDSAKTDDTTLTTHTLPATEDNPSGQYYLLNMDGTLGTSPITEISLRNTDGAVLIKASSLNRPNLSLSKSVSPTGRVSSGNTLTYTIQYVSNGNQDVYAARIEDIIPAGTTFVPGSAAAGGSFDGTKVIWNLGNLTIGQQGNVSFKVTVN